MWGDIVIFRITPAELFDDIFCIIHEPLRNVNMGAKLTKDREKQRPPVRSIVSKCTIALSNQCTESVQRLILRYPEISHLSGISFNYIGPR